MQKTAKTKDSWLQRDLAVNWHPCMQMKDFETTPPLQVVQAQDEWIMTADGRRYLDATSSWWCKSLGHGHPQLQAALYQQMQRFEHVIFANTTYDKITELSEALVALLPHCHRVLYAADGSCAVEMAVKMSVQSQQLRGQSQRTQLAALQGGYHGETILTLALSDCPLYSKPFQGLLPAVHRIDPVAYVTGPDDPLWHDASAVWAQAEKKLTPIADQLAGIICEPIIQGANGMRIYSADFLRRMACWCQRQGIDLIADEIMTGFGRTGRMFAHEYAGIQPDFVCLGKGLTGGMLPMSAVVTTEAIYQLFYDDYHTGKAFLHSHTHTGNALSAAVACEAVRLTQTLDLPKRANQLQAQMLPAMQEINATVGSIGSVRGLGAMVALERAAPTPISRWGVQVANVARDFDVLLRPLGNVIYWLPPLTITATNVNVLVHGTLQAIQQVDDL